MRISKDIAKAARLLKTGGIVAFPTETVYGLGACVFKPEAVARIFEVKKRPFFDPLIVHLPSPQAWSSIARSFPAELQKLAERFWPGPLTFLLEKKETVPDIVTAGLATVAVRVPAHPIAQALLEAVGEPIAAPSANRFGEISPTRPEHVRDSLGDSIDMILEGGACPVGVESTIVRLNEDSLSLLRPGGISLEELEKASGLPCRLETPNDSRHPHAPGQLPRHYAPKTPLYFLKTDHVPPALTVSGKIGVLCLSEPPIAATNAVIERLSPSGDLREAAARLFETLRNLDRMNLSRILAFAVPEEGLGMAINDRLRRAAENHDAL